MKVGYIFAVTAQDGQ